jgi:hypothetical protein
MISKKPVISAVKQRVTSNRYQGRFLRGIQAKLSQLSVVKCRISGSNYSVTRVRNASRFCCEISRNSRIFFLSNREPEMSSD